MEGGLFGAWVGLARLAFLADGWTAGCFGCGYSRSSCWRICCACPGVSPLMLLRSSLKSLCVIGLYEYHRRWRQTADDTADVRHRDRVQVLALDGGGVEESRLPPFGRIDVDQELHRLRRRPVRRL